MSTTTIPTYTANGAGNIHASASLAASATANDNYDGSAVFETQVHVKNTPGGSVAATTDPVAWTDKVCGSLLK